MKDPMIAQQMGQNPQAQMLFAALQAHIAEHLGFAYRKQIEERLGVSLPAPDAEMPPEMEVQLSRLVAQASQELLAVHQGQAAQQQAQQQAQDPLVQLQQAELQLKGRDVERKAAKDAQDADLAREKLRIEHFGALDLPCLFVSGSKDPFGVAEARAIGEIYREIIELVIFQELSYEDASAILGGMSLGTLRSRMFHALRRLRADGGAAVQHAVDGGDTHPRFLGDILDGGLDHGPSKPACKFSSIPDRRLSAASADVLHRALRRDHPRRGRRPGAAAAGETLRALQHPQRGPGHRHHRPRVRLRLRQSPRQRRVARLRSVRGSSPPRPAWCHPDRRSASCRRSRCSRTSSK